jgi:uncharacterized phage protein (TIGR01671 family)
MNREIKFRGISIDKWVYGMLCKVNEDDTEHGELIKYKIQTDEKEYGEYVEYFITDENTIGQYTGLHDKNGKEIYEGDIVRIVVNNNIEKICKVEFKNGIFGVMFSKNKDLTAFPHFCNTTFEVIGNVHENLELLGGE